MRSLLTGLALTTMLVVSHAGCIAGGQNNTGTSGQMRSDSVENLSDTCVACADSINAMVSEVLRDSMPAADENTRYSSLTEEDFEVVAKELGVEIAAIKAVVLIEAGEQMKGFWAPGIPVINFDPTMYRRYASKAPSKVGAKGEKVPSGLTGYAKKEWTQLITARKTNAQGANMGTFWGMFQIGGFNYKACGCQTVDEMVRLMSESEFRQLELFAEFIRNSGMLNDLKNKNWAQFARKYNGASYARRGYHTRMANAYAKFKKQNK